MNEVLYENAEKRQARLKKKAMKAYRKLKRKQYKSDMSATIAAIDAANDVKHKNQSSIDRARKKFEKYGKKSGIVKASANGSYMVNKDIDKEMQDIDDVENLKAGISTGFYRKPKKKKAQITNESLIMEGLYMSEYELLQLLEECGYEPSDENLEILKEDAGLIEELLIESKKLKKAMIEIEKRQKNVQDDPEAHINVEKKVLKSKNISDTRYDAYEQGRVFANDSVSRKDPEQAEKEKEFGRKAKTLYIKKEQDGDTNKPDTGAHEGQENRRTARKDLITNESLNSLNEARKGVAHPETSLRVALADSYTEYELMQILDENGFTTTDEDVALLREAIETGKVLIETKVTDKIAGLDKEPDYDSSELTKDNKTGETKVKSRTTYTDTESHVGSLDTPSSTIRTYEDNDTGEMRANVNIYPKYNGSKGHGGSGEADNKSTKISVRSRHGEPELKVEDEYAKVPEENKGEARKALKRKAAKRAMKSYSDSADAEVKETRYNRLVEKHGKEKTDKLIEFEEKKKAKLNAKPKLARKQ